MFLGVSNPMGAYENEFEEPWGITSAPRLPVGDHVPDRASSNEIIEASSDKTNGS